jgi:hypothetical protein
MSRYAVIPEEQVKKYAQAHRVSLLDAYRAIFSQKLLEDIDAGKLEAVLRELVYQVVGEGIKKPIIHMNGGRDVVQKG